MKKYTKSEVKLLKQMLELLRLAKPEVKTQSYMSDGQERLRRGLCGALWRVLTNEIGCINPSLEKAYQQLKSLIDISLNGATWFDDRLRDMNPHRIFNTEDIAIYRHQWIDQLIRDIDAAIKYSEESDYEKDHL